MKHEGREGKAGKYQRSGSFSLPTNKGTEEKDCSKASNLLPQREEKTITRDTNLPFLPMSKISLWSFFFPQNINFLRSAGAGVQVS